MGRLIDLPTWAIYVPGVTIVLAGIAGYRWLAALQRRTNDHAERIAHLEGRLAERDAERDAGTDDAG